MMTFILRHHHETAISLCGLANFFVTAQAEKRSVIKGEMTVGGKWADIRRADFHVNERLTSA